MERILIVEDEIKLAEMLEQALTEEGFNVELAYDGYVGNKLSSEKEFQAIVLDINLPLMNGYDVCIEIRKRNTKVPIIMLTAFSPLENKLAAFDAGADDYIVKPFEVKELIARMHTFIKKGQLIMPFENILTANDLELNIEKRTVKRGKKDIFLTVKEFGLLEHLLKNKGRVVSKAEIAETIWNMNYEVSTNIIEVYINYLRKKIYREFTTKLLHTVAGMGYIIREDCKR